MLKKLKENYDKLLKSEKFEKRGFLCGAFIMCKPEDLKNEEWQIDLYDAKKKEMITYSLNKEIKVEKSKAFKNEYEIKRLEINDVNFDLDKALEISSKMLSKYNTGASKIIVVLQKIEDLVWNVTYITTNFGMLNVKIDAQDGKLLSENYSSLLDFKRN